MQPYIFGDTAIIGIKVLIAPLVFRARRPFFIIPVIVDADCDYIFLSVLNIRSQIKTDSHDTILVQADILTIYIEIRPLTDSFKLYKNFLILAVGRQTEMFPIPHNRIGQFINAQAESLIFIEGMR